MGPYRRSRRRRRALVVLGAIRSALLTLAGAAGAISIVVFAICLLGNIRPLIVISGSMEPGIPVGSVVFSQVVDAREIRAGEVVSVERPRGLGLITHRVVSVEPADGDAVSMVLRGDANDSDDPQPYVVTSAGSYRLHVPWLGFVSAWLQTTSGLLFAASAAVGLVALYLLDPQRLGATQSPRASGRRRRESVRGG